MRHKAGVAEELFPVALSEVSGNEKGHGAHNKKRKAPSTMIQWATRKYSPVVARMSLREGDPRPKEEIAIKKRTRTAAKAKRADGILAPYR